MKNLSKPIRFFYTSQHLVWVLGLLLVLALAFYFYAINQTVYNIVERQNLEQELAVLSADIGALEFQYIRAKNAIGLETASEFGFVEQDRVTYVTRPSLGQADGIRGSI
ncbi:MAG: hypothetical protein WD049_09490 [Candidatus Paceibacterota bacterium]